MLLARMAAGINRIVVYLHFRLDRVIFPSSIRCLTHPSTLSHQAQASLISVDANAPESSRMENTGPILFSTCSKLARTPLPDKAQTSPERTNSQPSSAKSTIIETKMPLRTQPRSTRTDTPRLQRKRSAGDASTSSGSSGEECLDAQSAGSPRKRKRKGNDAEVPSLECLAAELTNKGAIERIRRHVVTHREQSFSLPTHFDTQKNSDWVQKTTELLNLAAQWDDKSAFCRLIAQIFRVHALDLMYIKVREDQQLDHDRIPRISGTIADKVLPHLHEKYTPDGFRRWVTLTRKLHQLYDYLPFMPFGRNSVATFRQYERLGNDDIVQLRCLLDNNPAARDMARVGRAFRHCILRREAFFWEDFCSEKLSKLPDGTLLHLLTTRRLADFDPKEPGSFRKQCDMCADETCELLTLVDQASVQPLLQAHEDRDRPPSSPTLVQANKFDVSATLRAPVDNSAHNNAFEWWADYTQLSYLGPPLQLSLANKVEDTALSIESALKGDIAGLQGLFSAGLANPRDTSGTRGFSLPRWGLYGGHLGLHNYDVVKFLVENGADVDDKLYESVGHWNLRNKYSRENREKLCCAERQDRNWFKEQNFPPIHKIIFRLSSRSLTNELLENPTAVHITDATCRTALAWATARAQVDDMQRLLAAGSDPNSMDSTGRTILQSAVDSHSIQAVQMILEAGAEPNPQIQNFRRGHPLTSASMNKHTDMVKMLLAYKAYIHAENPEGLTALHLAVITQNLECADVLLKHGAGMDDMSSNGVTPLVTAITQNRYQALRFLLGRRAEPLRGDQWLPMIAERADSETMSILASSGLFELSRNVDLSESFETVAWRPWDDDLKYAFDKLVSIRTGVLPPPPSHTRDLC